MNLGKEWTAIARRELPQWQACAKMLNLAFYAGTSREAPVIAGDIDGFELRVTCTDDRKGAAKPVTLYEVHYPAFASPIRITRETKTTRVGILRRVIDVKDLQIGDEVGDRKFDKLALIDAEDVETTAAFLTTRRRQAITELLGTSGLRDVVVSEATMSFQTRKVEGSAGRLTGNILGMVEFARVMADASTAHERPASGYGLLPNEKLESDSWFASPESQDSTP